MVGVVILQTACQAAKVDAFYEDCRAWCSKAYVCGSESAPNDACADRCQDEYELYAIPLGQNCEDAFRDAMACIANMTCGEYSEFSRVPVEQAPCNNVLLPYYKLCPGVFLAPTGDRT
jgi:hypothetical protein